MELEKISETIYLVKIGDHQLFKGDSFEVMDYLISLGIKVDAIICDPPYQTTACEWDILLPFNRYIEMRTGKGAKTKVVYEDEAILHLCSQGRQYSQAVDFFNKEAKDGMWERLNKLIKPNGAIVLFGSEPFSSALRMSNIKNYKYDWVWYKNTQTGISLAKYQPMRSVENIAVFSKEKTNFYPQRMLARHGRKVGTKNGRLTNSKSAHNKFEVTPDTTLSKTVNPRNVLEYKVVANANGKVHPTQKPVELMEYLIKTYTNENELVLDFTAGSFTTNKACQNLNRKSIGIEIGEDYFNIGVDRLTTKV